MSTQQYKIIRNGDEKTFDELDAWRDVKQLLDEQGVEYEAVGPDEQTDGGPKQNGHGEPDESQQESLDSSTETESDTDADIVEPDDVGVPKDEGESPAELAERVSPVKMDKSAKELAWSAYQEAWNKKGATESMSDLDERTARRQFERYWNHNHE